MLFLIGKCLRHHGYVGVKNATLHSVFLLFVDGDRWTRGDISDLNYRTFDIKNMKTVKHKNNFMSFQLLEKNIYYFRLGASYAKNDQHNERVDKNQHIFLWVTDILKLSGKYNVSIHGHNEKEGSRNKGILLESVY